MTDLGGDDSFRGLEERRDGIRIGRRIGEYGEVGGVLKEGGGEGYENLYRREGVRAGDRGME